MSASSAPKVTLQIRAATPMTEVRVSDARYQDVVLPGNSGEVDVQLNPGVYQVAFRSGKGWLNELVVLESGRLEPYTVFEPIQLQPQLQFGPDDEQEELTETAALQSAVRVTFSRRAAGWPQVEDLRLQELQVSMIGADGTGQQVTPDTPDGSMRYRRASLRPGNWFLRVGSLEGGREVELPLVCCPGWQTRVRLYVTPVSGQLKWDPSRTLVSLRRLIGGSSVRLTEVRIALGALAAKRSLAGASYHSMLRRWFQEKFDEPMLGLYAGHLLDCRTQADWELLDEVVGNLTNLVQTGFETHEDPFVHPDIAALRLRAALAMNPKAIDDAAPFQFPPMLGAGWKVLMEATRLRPELIPRGSLTAEFAARSFECGPWRGWYRPRPVEQQLRIGGTLISAVAESLGAIRRHASAFRVIVPPEDLTPKIEGFEAQCAVIRAGLSFRRLREWYRLSASPHGSEIEPGASLDDDAIELPERALAAALRPVAPDESSQAIFDGTRITHGRGEQAALTVREIAVRLGFPAATVEDAAASLASKLAVQARVYQLPPLEEPLMAAPTLIIPYDPEFLGDGFRVPLPQLSESLKTRAFAEGVEIPYTHFSLVMHAQRRVVIVAASNIDAGQKVQVGGGLTWRMDERIGDYQLGPETYEHNQLDRGHMVRREDVLWGSVQEARRANEATFFYSNAAPQHQNFNQDEWVTLEDWVLDHATDFSYRLCVLTGPVLRDDDPTLEELPPNLRSTFRFAGPAQIPAAFWKVVVLRDGTAAGEDLSVVAFAMRQTEMWDDRHGRKLLNLKVHQVTLEAIEEWTGLQFGALKDADELQWSDRGVHRRAMDEDFEWPVIRSGDDIVFSGTARRQRGARAKRMGDSTTHTTSAVLRSASTATGGCGCSGNSEQVFDARAAVEALNLDIVRLTNMLAARAEGGEARALRSVGSEDASNTASGASNIADTGANASFHASVLAATPAALRANMERFLAAAERQSNIAKGFEQPTEGDAKRIIGGDNVPPGGFQSCVCIGTATQWQCTGVLVAPRVVLTAAHCGGAITRVMVGGNSVTPFLDGRVVTVRKVVVHPSYRRNENDISVLILGEDANVPPVRIATDVELRSARDIQLVGFGYNDTSRPLGFGTKRQVVIPMAPIIDGEDPATREELERLLGYDSAYEFVAGRKTLGLDTCNGDSGGPAYIPSSQGFLLAGLTSRATLEAALPCGDGGIYVRPERFRSWLSDVLGQAGLPSI